MGVATPSSAMLEGNHHLLGGVHIGGVGVVKGGEGGVAGWGSSGLLEVVLEMAGKLCR
jgi:hypothetical protein